MELYVSMKGISDVDSEKEKKENKFRRLKCSVQNYDWGIVGEESLVARLYSLNSGSEIDSAKPYAELWMGTHGSGPSLIEGSESVSLKSWVSRDPSVLGEKVVEEWGTDLPFLFKVLSVAKALSIQAHPDKELAKNLHKLNPDIYKDDNHKPEMALAITEFEALCGFVSLQELKRVIHSVPEIVELVGQAYADQVLNASEQDGVEKLKAVLKSIFSELMLASEDAVHETVIRMTSRLIKENKVRELTEKEQLVLELDKQYPADVGVISAFFLNYVKLRPGEALYLGANEPHAYIRGECIECMATSDNVVRAGLTPKLRDVSTLCSMLTYKQGLPEILQGAPLNPYVKRYSPPFHEFEVDSCILPEATSTVFPAVPGPSLFLVTSGEGIMEMDPASKNRVSEGVVTFVPANTEIIVTSTAGLQLYRAGVNSKFLKPL
ncbi:hypothetical protein Scep_022619 [Stephania cephalantha]|uniref:mannose-6-phosphate isomerase n=1 Tax=Stephania cephalantha TaxID=152367 RepID=A0AAP0F5S4_9MAGN